MESYRRPDRLGSIGYSARVQFDNKTRYVDDIWRMVAADEQLEIRR
jgi:hypothetical protein